MDLQSASPDDRYRIMSSPWLASKPHYDYAMFVLMSYKKEFISVHMIASASICTYS